VAVKKMEVKNSRKKTSEYCVCTKYGISLFRYCVIIFYHSKNNV